MRLEVLALREDFVRLGTGRTGGEAVEGWEGEMASRA